VGERAGTDLDEAAGMLGHAPAAIDFLQMYLARARTKISGLAQLGDRPTEIDRSGPRGEEDRRGFVEVFPVLGGECVPVSRRDADRRGTADGERSDRLGHLRSRPAFELDLFVGQAPLVEEHDAVLFQPNDGFRL
jgi:hypothetical protein